MGGANGRDAAGSFDLQGGTGPITRMVGLREFLEVYKCDTTFRLQTADTIDPDRTNPDAPHAISRVDGVGSASHAVARSLIQGDEILRTGAFVAELDPDAVREQLHVLKEQLVSCEVISNRVISRIEAVVNSVKESGLPLSENGNTISNFPKTLDLVQDTHAFLLMTRHAISASVAVMAVILGVDVTGHNIRLVVSKLRELIAGDAHLLGFLDAQISDAERLANLRNGIEHPKADQATRIKDFHLTSGGKDISYPQLQLFPSSSEPLHEELRHANQFLIDLAEGAILLSLLERFAPVFPAGYAAIDPVDPAAPYRFRVSLGES